MCYLVVAIPSSSKQSGIFAFRNMAAEATVSPEFSAEMDSAYLGRAPSFLSPLGLFLQLAST